MKNKLWLMFPAGTGLAFLYGEEHVVPLAVYLVLDLVYAAAGIWLIRKSGRSGWFAVPAVLLFAIASYTGAPSAGTPSHLAINTSALVLCAVALILVCGAWTATLWDGPGRTPALLSLLLVLLGSAGYFANLVSRFAVVLSGSAPAQREVEERAWIASEYLQGLGDSGNFMVLLLVWMDLLQVAYVVLLYVAMALLANALGRAGRLTPRAASTLRATGFTLAGLTTLSAAAATQLPAAAFLAFGLTIPFMTTLLPVLLASTIKQNTHRRNT